MSNNRSHFNMACLASVAVLLGACSSTPDVNSSGANELTAAQPSSVKTTTLSQLNDTLVPKTSRPQITKPVIAKRAIVKRKVATRRAVAKKRYTAPKKAYVPPKPIVVAVHKPARSVVKSVAVKPKRVVRKWVKPTSTQQAKRPRANVSVASAVSSRYTPPVTKVASLNKATMPSLPRASAAMVASAPVIRPATVPRSQRKRSVYIAPKSAAASQAATRQQMKAQRQQQLKIQQAQQQQARAQWQKEQKALGYRLKWENDQRAKEQQLARTQMAQRQAQQQANAQRARIQQAQVQQQQARAQQAKLQRARQQQARVKQASHQPRVTKAVLRQPVKNYSQHRLTGDFAGNPRAEAFINMMVARHGFTPTYVAGVLSRAEATSWLRKQAYRDANPTRRPKQSSGPSWSNYRRRFITSKHINTGTAFYKRYRGPLQRAAAQYGVPEEYILGIMGVETIYGGNVGTDRAIDALATMSFMNSRRGNYFTSELESYFLMTRRAGLDPLKPKASYAGALGLPQFMPSNIKKYGVDYDGDGAVNLWTPHDAIGSVANYLRSHGWKPGEIAAIPAVKTGGRGYSNLRNGFKYKHSLTKLARKGLKPAYPGVSGMVNMVKLKTYRGNEYWVGGNNFYVITRYNHSSHYAMAVHQLAQEIRKRVKPNRRSNMPRVIEASADKDLLMRAANTLL